MNTFSHSKGTPWALKAPRASMVETKVRASRDSRRESISVNSAREGAHSLAWAGPLRVSFTLPQGLEFPTGCKTETPTKAGQQGLTVHYWLAMFRRCGLLINSDLAPASRV